MDEYEYIFLQAYSYDPENPLIIRYLRNIYFKTQRFVKSLDNCMKVISQDNEGIESWIGIIRISQLSNNKDFSNQGINQVYRLDLQHPILKEIINIV